MISGLQGIAQYVDEQGFLAVVNAAHAAWKLARERDTTNVLPFYAGPHALGATVRNLGFNNWPGEESQTVRITFTDSTVLTEKYRTLLVTMFTTMGIDTHTRDVAFNNGQVTITGQIT